MSRCLQLAQCGSKGAPPNPMVGAVVVCDGRIIGEGYHRKCGEAHAEVNAIASVKDPELLRRSTIYVSLEPCAHYGKTPPCAQLIIDKQIPRVVVGCRDPFARVDGRGITMLQEAGIDVTVGVLEDECRWLNRRFITYHTLHRPYITLKWAQSSDGFIDRIRTSADEPPVRFSTPATQAFVHKLRAENDAILVGHRTMELDRPGLDVRCWRGSNPQRVVLGNWEATSADILVYATLDEAMRDLGDRQVQSLLVEGGARTLNSFIESGLWDEVRIETAPFALGTGIPAPKIDGKPWKKQCIDGRIIDLIVKKS